ncbi:hypothetical protein DPEC_G00307290 [Dallia pectoralis]|uniref:Uncharacterized protein n=1 Tax=Dallia pectoralis TaxID=75939 RepID=A0ACC2FEB8_DALPE|nr:hypothetical protein DPEC_G00307290 [Dallia pectoralis]
MLYSMAGFPYAFPEKCVYKKLWSESCSWCGVSNEVAYTTTHYSTLLNKSPSCSGVFHLFFFLIVNIMHCLCSCGALPMAP